MKRVLVVLAACGSAPAATTEFFGQTIEPPRGLAWLRPGMSVADAKTRVPELHEPEHKGVREELVLDSGVGDVALKVRIDAGTVTSIVATVTGHSVRDLLERAWGPPQIARDVLGQPEVTWASESTHWKVKLDCGDRNCTIEYLPYNVLTAQFFGPHVVPPGELAKLRVRMKLAEARAIAPGPVSVRTGIATEVDGVKEYVAFDDKERVRWVYLNLPPRAEEVIAQAWGEPSSATEPGGKAVRVWPDPETGWRATLHDALGQSKDLRFENFQSAAQLFGDQPDSLDGLPHPVLGNTLKELELLYPDQLESVGKDSTLVLPPTEWERGATRIALALANGKVREISFSVPYKPHPPAKDALRELFVRKWGEPKKLENSPTLLFRDDGPRVEVRDDEPHGAWHVAISRK
jgi:hypothetical protein